MESRVYLTRYSEMRTTPYPEMLRYLVEWMEITNGVNDPTRIAAISDANRTGVWIPWFCEQPVDVIWRRGGLASS